MRERFLGGTMGKSRESRKDSGATLADVFGEELATMRRDVMTKTAQKPSQVSEPVPSAAASSHDVSVEEGDPTAAAAAVFRQRTRIGLSDEVLLANPFSRELIDQIAAARLSDLPVETVSANNTEAPKRHVALRIASMRVLAQHAPKGAKSSRVITSAELFTAYQGCEILPRELIVHEQAPQMLVALARRTLQEIRWREESGRRGDLGLSLLTRLLAACHDMHALYSPSRSISNSGPSSMDDLQNVRDLCVCTRGWSEFLRYEGMEPIETLGFVRPAAPIEWLPMGFLRASAKEALLQLRGKMVHVAVGLRSHAQRNDPRIAAVSELIRQLDNDLLHFAHGHNVKTALSANRCRLHIPKTEADLVTADDILTQAYRRGEASALRAVLDTDPRPRR